MLSVLWFQLPYTIYLHELDIDVWSVFSNLSNRCHTWLRDFSNTWVKHLDLSDNINDISSFWVAAIVLLWLLHQKGLFDPLYDWWEDHVWTPEERNRHKRKHHRDAELSLINLKKNHRHEKRHHKHDTQRRRSIHGEHRHKNRLGESDYHYYLHHVHKDKHKHGRLKNSRISEQVHLSRGDNDKARQHRRRKERKPLDSGDNQDE